MSDDPFSCSPRFLLSDDPFSCSGTGRQVADYLAAMPPTCPIIVHSANDQGASGMFFALKDAGWLCSRVYPCDDLIWIKSSWTARVRRYLDYGSR